MTAKRILVIDDEEAIQIVLQECLRELAGWEVIAASSGQEGLQVARSQAPDAILLDVSMPDMDGITTYEKLQSDAASRSIPVILLTAKAQADEQAQFAQLAIAGVILKPFDVMTLADQMAEILHWQP